MEKEEEKNIFRKKVNFSVESHIRHILSFKTYVFFLFFNIQLS